MFRDTEAIGKMDPFITIQYLDKKWKTTVLDEAGKNAVWNQTFELHIESLED
jgi:Ca2+-dependent lipid-binding protein